jgi:hypothetical protein
VARGTSSPSKNPLEGKIHEPRDSDSKDEYRDNEADNEVAEDDAPKRKWESTIKKAIKKQKMAPNLVHTMISKVVKPAPAKATPSKASKAKAPVEDLDLSESSNDSDDPPRVKG